ncbi:hypothetical protein Tco_1314755 [Tanacetum coccineum]
MPLRPDLSFAGLDDSIYKAKVSETITIASKTSKDSLEKPKTVRPSAPIIEDWDTDINNVTIVGPKAVVSAAVGNGENAVKSSACWIWRPTGNVIDHTSKDSGSYMFKRFDYVDLQGRLNQVLLKVPKQNNMYSFDLKNVIPLGGSRPDWLFDIDLLTNSMNYEPVTAGNQTNKNAGIKDNVDAVPTHNIIPATFTFVVHVLKRLVADDAGKKTNEKPANEGEINGQEKEGGASNKENNQNVQDFRAKFDNLLVQQKEGYANNTNSDSTVSPFGQNFTNVDDPPTDPLIPDLEICIFSGAYDDEDMGAEADLNNLETTMNVSPIPTTRIHKDHPKDQIIRDINSATQTRRMTKISEEHAMVSYIEKQRRTVRIKNVVSI